MSRATAWFIHIAILLVGATGLVLGYYRYFHAVPEPSEDDFESFAIVSDPLEPLSQHAHVLVAPLVVFAIGLIWRHHVWQRLCTGYRPRRYTGLFLVLLLLPMVATGYFLQVDDARRELWVWTHGISSTLWLGLYLAHQVGRRGEAVATLVDACASSTPLTGTSATPSTGAADSASTSGSSSGSRTPSSAGVSTRS